MDPDQVYNTAATYESTDIRTIFKGKKPTPEEFIRTIALMLMEMDVPPQ